jgi:hypothetical protein
MNDIKQLKKLKEGESSKFVEHDGDEIEIWFKHGTYVLFELHNDKLIFKQFYSNIAEIKAQFKHWCI